MRQNLPKLKVVDIRKLIVHEEADPNRVRRLLDKVKHDSIFTNPPIVASIRYNGEYVVLDGANRTAVFTKLGFKHLIVQAVDYQLDTKLETWDHLVYGLKPKQVLAKIKRLFEPAIARSFKLKGSRIICPVLNSKNLFKQTEALNQIVSWYKNNFRFYRLDNLSTFPLEKDKAYVIFDFPKFKPRDIVNFAKKRVKVPSGITRHVVFGRALRLDLPMAFLKSNRSLANKNKELQSIIKQRMLNNKIRFYQDSTYIYNE